MGETGNSAVSSNDGVDPLHNSNSNWRGMSSKIRNQPGWKEQGVWLLQLYSFLHHTTSVYTIEKVTLAVASCPIALTIQIEIVRMLCVAQRWEARAKALLHHKSTTTLKTYSIQNGSRAHLLYLNLLREEISPSDSETKECNLQIFDNEKLSH